MTAIAARAYRDSLQVAGKCHAFAEIMINL